MITTNKAPSIRMYSTIVYITDINKINLSRIKFKFTSSAINNKLLISKIIEIILYMTEINNKNLSAMKNNPLISTTCG